MGTASRPLAAGGRGFVFGKRVRVEAKVRRLARRRTMLIGM